MNMSQLNKATDQRNNSTEIDSSSLSSHFQQQASPYNKQLAVFTPQQPSSGFNDNCYILAFTFNLIC